MSIELITIVMFISLFALIFTGLPLAFALGSIAIIFSFFLWGVDSFYLIASRTSGAIFNYVMIAVPLFMFMANILERSGLADEMYSTMHMWMGPVRGGLAIGTIIICTALAAMSGISAVGVITMGLIAMPAMFKRGYNKSMVMGCVMAGGALGQLIPPSLLMVIYGAMAGVSVGQLFIGGIIPGLVLSGLFITYIAVRCFFQKDLAPAMSAEERKAITWKAKFISLRGVILPVLLIVGVLGSIFAGIATPTEAAGIGAFGAVLSSLIYRRLTWEMLKTASLNTMKTSCMVMWIMIGSLMFVSVYFAVGGADFVQAAVLGSGVNRYVILFGMQLVIFILGCLMDPTGITLLCTPIFLPICKAIGFDPLWFGVLFVVNLEMSYLTPPFGYNLFYMKAIVPPGITMADIYNSVWPYVCLQATGLVLCIIFPQLIMWLPTLMIK